MFAALNGVNMPWRFRTVETRRENIVFRMRLAMLTSIALLLTLLPIAIRPASAQTDDRCFEQTSQCINGRFRSFWEQNGGLSIFGYPISRADLEVNPDTAQSYLTQWFERNRFELHLENAAPYDVLLGRPGSDALARQGRDWQAEGREPGPRAGCLWFEQTGHNVCDFDAAGTSAADRGFLSYWQAEGLDDPALDAYQRSLALHGFPLTAPRMETNSSGDTVLAQWFERARFEWHPTNSARLPCFAGPARKRAIRSTAAAAGATCERTMGACRQPRDCIGRGPAGSCVAFGHADRWDVQRVGLAGRPLSVVHNNPARYRWTEEPAGDTQRGEWI